MIVTILVILLVLWLLGAIAPLNNGSPYFGVAPTIGYLVAVVLVVFLIVEFLLPALRHAA